VVKYRLMMGTRWEWLTWVSELAGGEIPLTGEDGKTPGNFN